MRALLAEDDPASRAAIRQLLRTWGFDVIVACDGTEAWEILGNPGAPNLILLDQMMPGMEGPEVCRRLREREGGQYPYVIVLSSNDEPRHRADALEAGADAFVSKGCSIPELKAGFVAARRHMSLCEETFALRAAIRSVMTYDQLTGMETRPCCLNALHRELVRAAEQEIPLGLMLVELDHMAKVNERYGRRVGDSVLREAAGRITPLLRTYDVAGRFRGNQFFLILPHVDSDLVGETGEKIRNVLGDEAYRTAGRTLAVTASIGAMLLLPGTDHDHSQAACLQTCEDALSRARDAGRNRLVMVAPDLAPQPTPG